MWIKGLIDDEFPVLVNANTIQSIRCSNNHVVCDLTGTDSVEIGKYKTAKDALQVLKMIEVDLQNYDDILGLPSAKELTKMNKGILEGEVDDD